MAEYEDYLIGDLKTGLFTGREAWIAPHDAWPVLSDAYIDKGVLKRRLGSTVFAALGSPAVIPSPLTLTHTTAISNVTELQRIGWGYATFASAVGAIAVGETVTFQTTKTAVVREITYNGTTGNIRWDTLSSGNIANGNVLNHGTDTVTINSMPISPATMLAGNYYLTGNIDAVGVNFRPLGVDATPFTGTFDGCGYRISNLTITGDLHDRMGLFGYCNATTIYNLQILNASITTTKGFVGILAGYLGSNTTVQGVTVSGAMTNVGSQSGGLVGGEGGGGAGNKIISCTVSDVTITSVGGVWTGLFAGTQQADFVDCQATGTLICATSGFTSGGFVGIARGTSSFTRCSVIGVMPSQKAANEYTHGGFAGVVDSPQTQFFLNSYYLNTLNEKPFGGEDEVQRFTFGETPGQAPTGGHYHIVFAGTASAAIGYQGTQAQAQAACDASFGTGVLEILGDYPIKGNRQQRVYFRKAYTRTDIAMIMVDTSALTGGGAPFTAEIVVENEAVYPTTTSGTPSARTGMPAANPIVGISSIQYAGYNEVVACSTRDIYNLHQDGQSTFISGSINLTGGEDDYFWFQEYRGSLYFCNGIDGILKFTPNYSDAATAVALMNTGTVTIQTCKMLFAYKNRLIIVSPKIGGVWYPHTAYYTDVNLDTVGAGNLVTAQITDTPVTGGYIGEVPVIFCRNGAVYHIAYTGDTDAPFTWERRSIDVGVQARMGTASFKDLLATVGLNRLLTYDRYQAQDYDLAVRGVLDEMSATKIVNSYAHRMLDRNVLYILYTRTGQTDHDRVLVFNFDEQNFSQAILTANCLFSVNGPWRSLPGSHSVYTYPVADSSYMKYELSGRKDGKILRLNTGNTDDVADVTTAITPDAQGAQLNPYTKEGLKAKLGWVKIFHTVDAAIVLSVSIYKDHSATAFKTVAITLSGTGTRDWKTVWVDGEVGEHFRFKISQTYTAGLPNIAGFEVHGMLLGFKRANRIGL